jgi:hypothetical protein
MPRAVTILRCHRLQGKRSKRWGIEVVKRIQQDGAWKVPKRRGYFPGFNASANRRISDISL